MPQNQPLLSLSLLDELPKGDFPPLEPFRLALSEIKDLSAFPKLDKRMIKEMDKMFSADIPELLLKARTQY